jgi:hypothetical protein
VRANAIPVGSTGRCGAEVGERAPSGE